MKKIFLLLTALAVFTSCEKDDQLPGNYQTPLPEATQTGKGTFACYVDGMAYIAKSNYFLLPVYTRLLCIYCFRS